MGSASDVNTFALTQSGTYTLAIEGRYFDNNPSGTAVFNLQWVTDTTNTLAIGSTVSDASTIVGQVHAYHFTLNTATRLYFDALVDADFYWRAPPSNPSGRTGLPGPG